ncbi:hypothetical protein FOMG_08800 [Fusarium oxysporum f. sp. melonis 26406]|uniref:Uncharacterized protein n=1 Tax=Fusarium oxysporum f. sp. melonis 26406 TaxID=1089452 RepID=X0AZI1_FUSOX|nr:hypothetical protein FOMG_08800 [Fusarium oxysporum f. sp. melonis 26406]
MKPGKALPGGSSSCPFGVEGLKIKYCGFKCIGLDLKQ